MTTKQKLLQAEGEELMRVLGEVLQPEGTHRLDGDTSYDKKVSCSKCGKQVFDLNAKNKFGWLPSHKEPCLSNPILLTWNVAMKWRDWAVAEVQLSYFSMKMREVYKSLPSGRMLFDRWVLSPYCKPEHYLKAAALCVIKARKEQK